MNIFEQWGKASIDIMPVVKNVLQQHKEDVIELNQYQLETFGKRSDNKKLSPYSKRYAKIRSSEGLPTDRKTLKRRGDMYNEMYALSFDNFMEIGSRNKVAVYHEQTYGDEIWGLSEQGIEKLLYEKGVAYELITEIRKQILK